MQRKVAADTVWFCSKHIVLACKVRSDWKERRKIKYSVLSEYANLSKNQLCSNRPVVNNKHHTGKHCNFWNQTKFILLATCGYTWKRAALPICVLRGCHPPVTPYVSVRSAVLCSLGCSLTCTPLAFPVTTRLWLIPRHPREFNPIQPNFRHGLDGRNYPWGIRDTHWHFVQFLVMSHLHSPPLNRAPKILLSLSKFIGPKQIIPGLLKLPPLVALSRSYQISNPGVCMQHPGCLWPAFCNQRTAADLISVDLLSVSMYYCRCCASAQGEYSFSFLLLFCIPKVLSDNLKKLQLINYSYYTDELHNFTIL